MVAYSFYHSDNRVRRYAETLAKLGHDVEAITLRRDGDDRVTSLRGVKLFGIQRRQRNEKGPLHYLARLLQFFFRSAWMLTVRHLRRPYDLIHVHSVPDFQVFSTIIPKLLGTRVILDIHDIVPEFYASKFHVPERSLLFRALLLMERLSSAYADHVIIANDIWHRKLTSRSIPKEKCTAIINYPDPTIFRPRGRRTSDDDSFIALYPGTLNEHNGLDLAIDAVGCLREKVPNLRFIIVGDGPDRSRLIDLINSRNLSDRIFVEGVVPIEEIADRMASIDLGVVPKRANSFGNEAFSTKIMEFMATGVPVIASKTKIDQYYFNDSIVQFFEPGNVEDLADKILTLYRDPQRRNTLSDSALSFIERNNWNAKSNVYSDLVERLILQ